MRVPAPSALAALCLLAGCASVETRTPLSLRELRTRGAVLQTHEYSCGAAALATLMGMHGRPATEMEVLGSIFGKNLPMIRDKDGLTKLRALNLEDLEKGARAAGFKVVSLTLHDRRPLEEALKTLRPAIARLKLYDDYLHFVVLRDLRDGWVHITDPAYGNVKVTVGQFHGAWEKGDRVLLAIGRKPFEAWKVRDGAPIYLRRAAGDELPAEEGVGPAPLYKSVQTRLVQLGTTLR